MPNLVAGVYRLCTQTPRTAWLNSCEWGATGTNVTLASDQAAQISIVLTKGALVSVQMNDPAQLRNQYEGKQAGASILLGVGTDAHSFLTAQISAQSAAARMYQLLLPFDRSLNISIGSTFFLMSDATGKALPKVGNLVPVMIPSGQQAATIVLNVTGTASLNP
ncbi:MAG TPA: hypothetical protein VKU01_14465 [Bryobacteraceae bacterium]|nr:hypothetical protein [Bryobacteraceae bacterium]